MTVTVELLNDEALALLQNLERLHVLKLLAPGRRTKEDNGNSVAEPAAEQIQIAAGKGMPKGPVTLPPDFDGPLENYPSGFGCAKGMIQLSPDWDEPLEDFKEYMY